MTKRKFYKTVIRVEVLSEEPFEYESLMARLTSSTDGDCSGDYSTLSSETMNGKEAADALLLQGSDPSFFQLTDDGDDTDAS